MNAEKTLGVELHIWGNSAIVLRYTELEPVVDYLFDAENVRSAAGQVDERRERARSLAQPIGKPHVEIDHTRVPETPAETTASGA